MSKELCKGNYSVENCAFCTGLWHPMSGGFCGHKREKRKNRPS
uniref:Uncharacterized protein n=1 Tax=Leersia perrieri TaxID=77586 RepID=A0A0D9WRG8_9ORYZ